MKWYSQLACEGFVDIENLKNIDGPLKRSTGTDTKKQIEAEGLHSSWPEPKFQRQEELFHHPELMELLDKLTFSITKRSILNKEQLKRILELQIDGQSSREIGTALELCYRTVQRAQKKMLSLALMVETR